MSLTTNNINQNELRKLAAREGYTFFGLTVPYLIMVTALIAIPVGWLFYLSFIGRDGTFSFENYERMWKSKAYIKIFITTFKISILTTVICAAIGYPLAYFMSQLSRKVGKYMYDWCTDPFLDQSSSENLCLVGSSSKERIIE